jgi:hypothetical protein
MMKDHARGFAVTLIVFVLALPVLYVGGEGSFYLATGRSHFPPGSGYRTLYAPLDALGDRWPAVDDARESTASVWLRFDSDPERRIFIRGNHWPGFTLDVC